MMKIELDRKNLYNTVQGKSGPDYEKDTDSD